MRPVKKWPIIHSCVWHPSSIYCAGHWGELQKVSPRMVIITSPVHHQLMPISARRRADTVLCSLEHTNLLNPNNFETRHHCRYTHHTDEDTEVQQGYISQDTALDRTRPVQFEKPMPVYSSMVLSLSHELESPGACESRRLPSPTSRSPLPEGLGGIPESASGTSA